MPSTPLVSILIPAYNAERTLAETLASALGQTWERKEIILVNDGSTDRTAEVASRFQSKILKVVTTENQGLSSAVNTAYQHSQGDYIQELDADDLISPNKVESQVNALRADEDPRTLVSCPWGYFFFRPHRILVVPTELWQDQLPVDWLVRKLSLNIFMQNATWLMSRQLADAAGSWNEQLRYDQDGEYYSRAIAAASRIRFVPDGLVYYRTGGTERISFLGRSDVKKNSMIVSMQHQIAVLRSLEDSERVRRACIQYLNNWFHHFCPSRPDLACEMQRMAAEVGGQLQPPDVRPKYSWLKFLVGRSVAESAQEMVPRWRSQLILSWDHLMYRLEQRLHPTNGPGVPSWSERSGRDTVMSQPEV